MYDEYDAPDVGRENYEELREEEREAQWDRYTVAELKEMEEEEQAEAEARAEAVDAKNKDYALDMMI